MAIQPKCSICGKGAAEKFKPFCSSRCATIDLGRWLGDRYAIPAEEEAAEGELTPRIDHENEN